jgi:site-specific recombinase XerC
MKSNRPIKGSIHRKEPIRDHRAIEEIKKLLNGKKRDLALFVLAINSNLRACDLLSLIIDQVKNLQVGDDLVLREKKTKKIRRIVINRAVWHALNGWLEIHPQLENGQAPLYLSRKGGALRVATLSGMVKSWCNAVGLTGSYGCHTLRKTFGYQHRVMFKTDLPTLQTIYGHSHQRQTLDYLCVQPDEVRDAYMKEI